MGLSGLFQVIRRPETSLVSCCLEGLEKVAKLIRQTVLFLLLTHSVSATVFH